MPRSPIFRMFTVVAKRPSGWTRLTEGHEDLSAAVRAAAEAAGQGGVAGVAVWVGEGGLASSWVPRVVIEDVAASLEAPARAALSARLEPSPYRLDPWADGTAAVQPESVEVALGHASRSYEVEHCGFAAHDPAGRPGRG